MEAENIFQYVEYAVRTHPEGASGSSLDDGVAQDLLDKMNAGCDVPEVRARLRATGVLSSNVDEHSSSISILHLLLFRYEAYNLNTFSNLLTRPQGCVSSSARAEQLLQTAKEAIDMASAVGGRPASSSTCASSSAASASAKEKHAQRLEQLALQSKINACALEANATAMESQAAAMEAMAAVKENEAQSLEEKASAAEAIADNLEAAAAVAEALALEAEAQAAASAAHLAACLKAVGSVNNQSTFPIFSQWSNKVYSCGSY
tara:strand:+ start:154 stop:939 length:786 start_codon:yes stop_codon:yes gene_type:complete